MCGPTAFLIGSTLFSAVSQISQSRDQAANLKAQARDQQTVAEFNAKQLDNQARDTRERGANEAANIRENARKANATGRAVAGSTGFLADTGNNLDIGVQNAGVGAYDSLITQNNAEREALGYSNDAIGKRWQAELGVADAKRQGSAIKRNGLLSAAGTLVKGGYDYSSKFGSTTASGPSRGNFDRYLQGGSYR